MIRKVIRAIAATSALLSSNLAIAKQYVDYTPQKGVWEIVAVEVDPNHVDEYLTGLRRSDVPGFEIMKKHGIIDDYRFLVRYGYAKGSPSVLIETHYVSAAMLEPDQARDQMIEKEIVATMSEADGKAAVAGYEKYRQFVEDALWGEVRFAK
ncbi:hypothetical protein [Sphingomonas sp. PAMC 26605]|uniref:hypothetical protein n=1 Tax=Sphingomonas sp. PAMC 26605 TaxID=1112214 RepID=UPI00026CCBB5|nr:hypothetical protein [Sphingomonas sp. PAMC 26605]